MKKILLFVLVFGSLNCLAQTPILLDTVNNACHIDKTGFAKDNMTYTLNGDSSINLFIISAPSYQNAHYSRFRDPAGSPFANRTALTNWLDLYFFANALVDTISGGGDTATLESVTTGAGYNITPNAMHVTGFGNIVLDKNSTAIFEGGSSGGIYRIDSTAGNIVGAVEISNTVVALTADAGNSTLNVRPETVSDASVLVSGRITADAGVNANDVAVMSQITTLGETSTTAYRGDRGVIAYDHSQLTSGTNPHNTIFANIASLPTTTAGYGITDAIINGGNSPGAALVIGTNNNNAINFRGNNVVVGQMSTSGNLYLSGVGNFSGGAAQPNNAFVQLMTTGVVVSRNIADANTVAKFNHTNASSTGFIAEFQKAGVTNASISNTGSITGLSFIKTGGTSAQFLKADGSIDANSYVVGTAVGTLKSGGVTLSSDGLVVTFIVDHNFGSTGYEVSLTPTSVLAASPCYVVNKQANTFQITFITPPAVGSPSFDWIIHKN